MTAQPLRRMFLDITLLALIGIILGVLPLPILDNVRPQRWLYSWGFGFRIQLPVFPFRIYFAQKLYSDSNLILRPIPGSDDFQVSFGIADVRF